MSVVAMCVKCDEWDTLSCLQNHKCGSTSLLLPQELCNNGNLLKKEKKSTINTWPREGMVDLIQWWFKYWLYVIWQSEFDDWNLLLLVKLSTWTCLNSALYFFYLIEILWYSMRKKWMNTPKRMRYMVYMCITLPGMVSWKEIPPKFIPILPLWNLFLPFTSCYLSVIKHKRCLNHTRESSEVSVYVYLN